MDTCIGAGRDRTKLLEDNVDRAHDGNGLRGVRGQTQRHLFILRSAARRAAVPSRRFLSPYAPPFHLFNFPEAHKPDGPQRLVGLFLFLFLQLLFPFTNSQLGHAQKKIPVRASISSNKKIRNGTKYLEHVSNILKWHRTFFLILDHFKCFEHFKWHTSF